MRMRLSNRSGGKSMSPKPSKELREVRGDFNVSHQCCNPRGISLFEETHSELLARFIEESVARNDMELLALPDALNLGYSPRL
jgi:hypothetical protein